jgi:hypothetical protein
MNWTSLASTAMGGLLVLVSTLVVERVGWKRSRTTDAEERRRKAYAEYLASLADAGNNLRALSRQNVSNEAERLRLAHEAFARTGVHGRRYEVAILSPDSVSQKSDQVFVGLRHLRNLADQGKSESDPTYRDALRTWQSHFAELRQLMRADVGDVKS